MATQKDQVEAFFRPLGWWDAPLGKMVVLVPLVMVLGVAQWREVSRLQGHSVKAELAVNRAPRLERLAQEHGRYRQWTVSVASLPPEASLQESLAVIARQVEELDRTIADKPRYGDAHDGARRVLTAVSLAREHVQYQFEHTEATLAVVRPVPDALWEFCEAYVRAGAGGVGS